MSWLATGGDTAALQGYRGPIQSGKRRWMGGGAVLVVAMLVMAASAACASADVQWQVTSEHGPTNFAPGGTGQYIVRVRNAGDAAQTGVLTVTDTLPAGMVATNVRSGPAAGYMPWSCSGVGTDTVTCTQDGSSPLQPANTEAPPNASNGFGPAIEITVAVSPISGVFENAVLVSGGGGLDASTTDPTTIGDTPAGFGFLAGSLVADVFGSASPGATVERQAGSHPFELRVQFANTLKLLDNAVGIYTKPVEDQRTLITKMPPGVIGNPEAVARCTGQQLQSRACPVASQVGTADLVLSNEDSLVSQDSTWHLPVYNLVRPDGAVAALGFLVTPATIEIDVTLDPNDRSVVAAIKGVPQTMQLRTASLTLWGVPADPAHDALRVDGAASIAGVPSPDVGRPRAFLGLPSQCSEPVAPVLSFDSWLHPDQFVTETASAWSLSGCGDPRMRFDPSVSVQPDVRTPGSPTGLDVMLSVPQKDDSGVTDANRLYSSSGLDAAIPTPPLRDISVTLPSGLAVSPSSANGLEACSLAQIGLESNDEPACPDASKIGSVVVETPVLPESLQGSVFLARQNDNPFKSLLALYIVVEGQGVMVKLPGEVKLDSATGQVSATFDENPQFPFSSLRLRFKGGSRAALVTPPVCGLKRTEATMSSWNASLPAVQASDPFTISGDGQGAPCPAQSFSPGFMAGTHDPVAGAFAAFSVRLTRTDGDSQFKSLSSLSLPRGLLADVGSVSTRCTNGQADAASCPAASHIGELTVGAGAGPDPFYVGGDVYLTTPYKGNPFGLAVIVHAAAGPFDLGYAIVKGGIQIHDDGSASITTDPFPTILQGIPLRLKDIRVEIDRPHFMINPTSCVPMSVDGSVISADGQTASVSNRFQVGECAALPFNPGFAVSTAGRTRRATGTSLTVKVISSKAQANIRGVHVSLPRALPSRLSTLNQACPAGVFETNPAGCPVGSIVGSAKAISPLLAVPLQGPAYLVSHGGLKFPDLVLVLQGEGIVLHIVGHTDIKGGITTSTFDTVPDAPISSFELKLPAGPHSALAAPRSLCDATTLVTVRKRVTQRIKGRNVHTTRDVKQLVTRTFTMPTTITGQNGAVVHRSTKIAVTGCVRHKTKTPKK